MAPKTLARTSLTFGLNFLDISIVSANDVTDSASIIIDVFDKKRYIIGANRFNTWKY
jgi:hypothetical protein